MTFVELILLLGVGALLYRLMRPLQRWLEGRFYKFFRSKSRSKDRPIIDITDYSRKKDKT
jgi:hypothetical protein